MNHARLLSGLILIPALFCGQAFADGLFRKLPSDGSWATYRMSETWSDGTKREIDVTLKAFGRESIDGKECTWIEIVFQTPDRKTRRAFRFLAPNDCLKTGADPLRKAVDVWVRKNDGQSRRDMSWDDFLPRLSLVCPPQMNNETVLDETEIVIVGGDKLKSRIVTGTSQTFGPETTTTIYRLATSDMVPFGVARATLSIDCIGKLEPTKEWYLDAGTVKFVVTAIGKNAKPFVQVGRRTDEPEPE